MHTLVVRSRLSDVSSVFRKEGLFCSQAGSEASILRLQALGVELSKVELSKLQPYKPVFCLFALSFRLNSSL